MKENIIIAVLVVLIILVILMKRSSGLSTSSGLQQDTPGSTPSLLPVILSTGVSYMTLDQITTWNANPANATIYPYNDPNGTAVWGDAAARDAAASSSAATASGGGVVGNSSTTNTVHLNSSTSQTMTVSEINTWNADPTHAADQLVPYPDGENYQVVFGTPAMRDAAFAVRASTSAVNAAAEEAAWTDYPASDHDLYTSLTSNMSSLHPGSKLIIDAMIAQVSEQPSMSIINSAITLLPSNLGLVPYTSEEQIGTMFTTAANSGESGLSKTDRVILRLFTGYSADMFILLKQIHTVNPSFIEKYVPTSDGKCPWSDGIFADTNQTIQGNIKSVLILLKKFNNVDSSNPKPVTDAINLVLPARFERMEPTTYLATMISISLKPNTPVTEQVKSFIWFIKYVTAGPMYTWWVAKNKWKLDPNYQIPLIQGSASDLQVAMNSASINF
jgi:hypothetical protein